MQTGSFFGPDAPLANAGSRAMTIVERRSHRTIEEDLVIGFSLSCAADRTAALSGPFKVATVAGDAALLKRCRHRSPG
ncbi:hypothetical protein WP12_15875 [Sphingomonas sp. SRS2]|nr:hypothetical protein WP12_15875 [Sphingomonas sp. SRS2]